MARRACRSIDVSTTVTLDEVDYEVSGNVTPGTPARPWAYGGEGDPGDSGEVTDVEMKNSGTGVEVDFYSLPQAEQEHIIEALSIEAEEDAIARASDEDDRRCDAARDARFER